LEDFGLELAQKTKTEKDYRQLMTLLDELQDAYDMRPEEPKKKLDVSSTQAEILDDEHQYRLDYAKYELDVAKKKREIFLAERNWKKLLKQNKEVRELLKKARQFSGDLGKFKNMCHDKAQIAKLNITVSDANVREALR